METKADKLQKKAIRDQQKRIKPGECQKYVRMVLDSDILFSKAHGLGHDLKSEIDKLQLNYVIRNLPLKMCVIWERQTGQRELLPTDNLDSPLSAQWDIENQVIQFHTAEELSKERSVSEIVRSLQSSYPEAKHTVALLGHRNKTADSKAVNYSLIDLQVLHQTASVQIPPIAGEVAATLRRFTKAIAEAPYKQQKSETLGTFKKFLANDKKQCVRVVGTSGFGRLWQQHLNRLPLVTLEVAETIIAQYPCPKRLIDAFEKDAETEREKIADLKINRGAPQPLQSDRRIGNVLSGKLHMLYNSRDPNAII
ncbi:crossover junction endonuclease EME1 [Ceratitis capitata]|uniref:crossover junction endonuclease EME1 n=1 Tax=Ceratitis capitata TaxID=7213 RepID=UPI00032A1B48|nr:crossover junction endonuclease EME1 [Ceratitis capitata]